MRLRACGSTALLAVAGALCGCATLAPPSDPTTTATATANPKLARAQAIHEYPAPHPAPQRPSIAAPTPAAAIRTFATAYINWNARTVAADLRVLAAVSIGQARSAMQLAAAGAARDYELQRGGIANSGQVEAVAPRAGSRSQYVVVTRERTTAANSPAYQGLRPAWHLTLATVSRLGPGQWALSGWQPES
jgi:hypothetical protein